ncbi:MAG TPA: hypothetical protein VKQ70_09245 [Caulobacteraceae bacterium]|jgi:hypothetical protein|nr:hypothetical protein [Caulobacteraceae bacterium]
MASASQLEGAGQGSLARMLARLTAREAWLLAGLGLLALLTAAFYAMQWSSGERDRYVAAQADVALAQQTRAAAARQGSADADLTQLGAAEAWTTHAHDLWLARLAIEQRLSAAALASHLPAPEIKVAEALESNSDIPLLKAEISGPYLPGPWLAFMRAIAGDGPAFVIDKLDVSDATTAQFSLTLLVPVQLDQAPQPTADPAAAEPAA